MKTDIKIQKKASKCHDECINCGACIKNCVIKGRFEKGVKDFFKCVAGGDVDEQKVFECSLCGLCRESCPKNIDMKDLIFEIKKDIVKKDRKVLKRMKLSGVRLHQQVGFNKAFTKRIKAENRTRKIAFMPGCSLVSNDYKLVYEIYGYMKEKNKDMGLLINCCSKPTYLTGDYDGFLNNYSKLEDQMKGLDEIITACGSCYNIIKKHSPNMKVTSLWEFLDEKRIYEDKKIDCEETFYLHDPCPTRNEEKIHESVRRILKGLNIDYREYSKNRRNTVCCGKGGMSFVVNRENYMDHSRRRFSNDEKLRVISYCQSCVESSVDAGVGAVNILRLIFSDSKPSANKSLVIKTINRYMAAR